MEEEPSDYGQWDELIPDALGLIFKKLPLKDILTLIPRVCKSWGKAVQGPYCWQEVDIDEWSTQCEPEKLNRMLRLLITRSCGSLRKLYVSCVNDDEIFDYIVENAASLETLAFRRSQISDSTLTRASKKLTTITTLDISYCPRVGTTAFESIGHNCKSLTSLSWNMHPLNRTSKTSHTDEVHAIADTMPQLKHLELAYLKLKNKDVKDILLGCPNLVSLDLRGCWEVDLDKKYLQEKHPKVKVLGPDVIMGIFESLSTYCCSDSEFSDDDYMDYSDDESFDGMWDDDGVELRVFEGSEMYEFGWPPSP